MHKLGSWAEGLTPAIFWYGTWALGRESEDGAVQTESRRLKNPEPKGLAEIGGLDLGYDLMMIPVGISPPDLGPPTCLPLPFLT